MSSADKASTRTKAYIAYSEQRFEDTERHILHFLAYEPDNPKFIKWLQDVRNKLGRPARSSDDLD